MAFGNGQSAHYRSSVTNEQRKVTSKCPLLITHIRNGYETTTVTTTSHGSHEMAISLGPQRTLVMGTKTETRSMELHLWCINEMRRVYFTRISAQLVFKTGTKQQPLPQLLTGDMKMTVSLGPHGTLVMSIRTKPVTVNQYQRRVQ
jgi:hypothetical protein